MSIGPTRLQITASLGPASEHEGVIRTLARVATRFRLNASHLGPEGVARWLERLQALFSAGMPRRSVVIDLQGAKMRLGGLAQPLALQGEVMLEQLAFSNDPGVLPVPHPELFKAVRVGEQLSADDGRVLLRVSEAVTKTRLRAVVERRGTLQSHKGINRPNHPVTLAALGARDHACIEIAESHGDLAIDYAFSFVHTGREARALRELTRRPVVAKIERPEAFDHLDAIDAAFDELWLCRGDLGAQAGLRQLGPLQARFVEWMQGARRKPGLLAGEVLGHMVSAATPTRAEVVQLYQLGRDGFSGFVLSDETAVGAHPLEVARLLEELLGIA